MSNWSLEDANRIYNIDHWGDGYFAVNTDGNIAVRPNPEQPNHRIDLAKLAEHLQAEGMTLPVLVRFSDILQNRVNRLCDAFDHAMAQQEYSGGYTAIYPIKVNQQRRVVEELLDSRARAAARVGLEAGSKPELLAVLTQSTDHPSMIICNGYKDREYIRLALMGEQLGHKVHIVIEKLSELDLVLEEAAKLNIKPRIGVRARLASVGKGHWQDTGGEKSKFGLAATQILTLIEQLRAVDALDCLQLLHFHLGSQIANIRDIQRGLKECGRFYHELYKLGASIKVVDVGGGLGVDYEGTRSRSSCSINYSMSEYANNVVAAFQQVCQTHDLPHPHLLSESGRALTAHHAVLITNVIDIERHDLSEPEAPEEDAHPVLLELWRVYQRVAGGTDDRALVESYHDAIQAHSEAQDLYVHGLLDMPGRALSERIYLSTSARIRAQLNPRNRVHREILDELNEVLADKLFVNFSLFQSLPDVWGIDQVFPILPLSGLDQAPTRRGVIQDITCDSDGRVDHYVDGQGVESTLPLPEWRTDENGNTKPRLLGFFMVGAYQEILGDLHNLFGDTDSVDLVLDENGEVVLENIIKGDSVSQVLRYVNFEPQHLLAALQSQLNECELSDEQKAQYRQWVQEGLEGYTYLE